MSYATIKEILKLEYSLTSYKYNYIFAWIPMRIANSQTNYVKRLFVYDFISWFYTRLYQSIIFFKLFQRLKILNLVTILLLPIISIFIMIFYKSVVDNGYEPMYKISHIIITSISILLMYIFLYNVKTK